MVENITNSRCFDPNCFLLFAVIHSAKNQLLKPTPRKLPFCDTTNKDLLKSAVKPKINGVQEEINTKQEEEASSSSSCSKAKEEQSPATEFDEPFVFPPDKNCFCCGDDQKSNSFENFTKFS